MNNLQDVNLFTKIVLEIFKVSGLLTTEGDRLTENFGLSSARWKIMGAIARSNTPLTVSQIARMMGQARQSVQRLVDVMYKNGTLKFLDNPNHKRAKHVILTTKGRDIYTQLDEMWNPCACQYSESLKKEDLKATLSTLKKITGLLDA